MKIGIDARFYGEAGPGRYAKNIVEHLEGIDRENQYTIFLIKKNFNLYTPKNDNFKKVLADFKWYSWGEQIGFLLKVLKYNFDVFYVPHFNIPVLYDRRLVTAIPDLIMHSFSTEKGTTLFKPYFKFKKLIYKFVVKWAVIKSFRVIVPSQDVLQDFLKFFPNVKREKYVLAYEGVDPNISTTSSVGEEVLKRMGIKSPFLLYTGSMYEHKNVLRLVDAFELLQKNYKFTGQLVIVGKRDKYSEGIQRYINQKKLDSYIVMPGLAKYVTDDELSLLRKRALLYVFPSLKEGFSLTPLEAQKLGLPCVISDIPCHKEIYKISVVYFDPKNAASIAQTIYETLNNKSLLKELISSGYNNVKKYDWKKTAEITLNIFKQAFETR